MLRASNAFLAELGLKRGIAPPMRSCAQPGEVHIADQEGREALSPAGLDRAVLVGRRNGPGTAYPLPGRPDSSPFGMTCKADTFPHIMAETLKGEGHEEDHLDPGRDTAEQSPLR